MLNLHGKDPMQSIIDTLKEMTATMEQQIMTQRALISYLNKNEHTDIGCSIS